MKTKRDNSFDLIRVAACFMVVLNHSPMPGSEENGMFLCALSYLSAPCIGLFLMLSGAILLPVKTDYTTFIRKRLTKILIPTLVWTGVYLLWKAALLHQHFNWWQTILSLPFSTQGTGVLWYMYTLTGIYLMAPVVSAWLEKARRCDLEIVLGLWVVTLCYPYLKLWLHIDESMEGVLYYFSGYGGYMLLGYYLRRYGSYRIMWCGLFLGLSGAMVLYFCRRRGIEVDFFSMFWHLSIFVAGLTAAYWILLRRLWEGRSSRFLSQIGNLTFGVYLCHILIMRGWLWHTDFIKTIDIYPLQSLVIAIITFAISLFVTWCLTLLPIGNYVVGYRQRK